MNKPSIELIEVNYKGLAKVIHEATELYRECGDIELITKIIEVITIRPKGFVITEPKPLQKE